LLSRGFTRTLQSPHHVNNGPRSYTRSEHPEPHQAVGETRISTYLPSAVGLNMIVFPHRVPRARAAAPLNVAIDAPPAARIGPSVLEGIDARRVGVNARVGRQRRRDHKHHRNSRGPPVTRGRHRVRSIGGQWYSDLRATVRDDGVRREEDGQGARPVGTTRVATTPPATGKGARKENGWICAQSSTVCGDSTKAE